MNNEQLLEAAQEAINELFNDRSVSLEKAIENLELLIEEIDIMVKALNYDIQAQRIEEEDY